MENIKKTKIIVYVTYLYLMIPFLIFAVGWMGKRYWVPILLVLAVCYWKICKDTPAYWRPELSKENILKIVFICLIIFIWVYFSGIGRLVFQNKDHNCRNAIYEILVSYDWPIVNYDVTSGMYEKGISATSLIYYIGFWLPSAVIGKIFGVNVGYGFQVFWAILGICLIYYFICARKEKLVVWPLVIFIFFSGLDIVGQYLRNENILMLENSAHIEWWVSPYQYSSMTTQLFWVFNQAIPAWLCTILAYMQKNNKSLVFILACCMLPSTFPFVGLIPFVLFWMFGRNYGIQKNIGKKKYVEQYIRCWVKDTLTVQNVLGGGIIGIFSFLYLVSNVSGNRIMEQSTFGALHENNLLKYIMFIIVEIGVYVCLLYKLNQNNKLYYLTVFCLCIIPPIKVGNGADFCMRASIPALFLLMLLVIDGLSDSRKTHKSTYYGLILALCIGSVTPMHEITRTFSETVNRVNEESQVYETSVEPVDILTGSNFSGQINDNFFFKYIAR